MTLMCIKQHLSNIWSSIHEKLSNADADLRKNGLIIKKKTCISLVLLMKAYLNNFLFRRKIEVVFA